jgi:hypothetical protein
VTLARPAAARPSGPRDIGDAAVRCESVANVCNGWKADASMFKPSRMPQYIPLEDVRVTLDADPIDVLKVEPDLNSLGADFIRGNDSERALRVTFDRGAIVRLLDDMPLSTEYHSLENEVIVPYHFAYKVLGHSFLLSQSQFGGTFVGRLPTTNF